jgi:hypothetical protein
MNQGPELHATENMRKLPHFLDIGVTPGNGGGEANLPGRPCHQHRNEA